MNEKITNSTFAFDKKINDIIRKTYNKLSYSIKNKFYLNEKYEYDNDEMTNDFRKLVEQVEKATIDIESNMKEIMNILEQTISNDVTQKQEISLFLRPKSRQQDANIGKKQIMLVCNNY